MKKLVYLLVLSLCVNGLAGASLPWLYSARAASKTEEKSEKQTDKKSKKEKSEKKTSKDQSGKGVKDSEKSEKKQKKTKVEKEKEYILDLAKNNQVALSVILEFTKMDIKLKDVKSVELEDEKDKKRIRWEKDEENEGDYIFTVLKNFKELRLRIVTKKTSRLLVLTNGAKGGAKDGGAAKVAEETKEEATKAPSDEKQEKPADPEGDDGEAKEAPADEQAEESSDAGERASQDASDMELVIMDLPMQEQTEVDEDKETGEDDQFVESIVSVTKTAMDAAESQDETTEGQGASDSDQPGEGTESGQAESPVEQPGEGTESQQAESAENQPVGSASPSVLSLG